MFSFVIPLYNKGHTITDTLESVLSQTHSSFEVVVVDDGSTDSGPRSVAQYLDDPRIRLIPQKHQGASAARNRGVAAACHELIAFLDADDILFPRYLEAISEAIQKFPDAGMYTCAGYELYPDGSGYARTSFRYRAKSTEVKYFRNPLFYGNASSTVVRKTDFIRCGGFPVGMTNGEDLVLFSKIALQTTVVFCSIPMMIYRKGVEGQISEAGVCDDQAVIDRINNVYGFGMGLEPGALDPLFIESAMAELRHILLKSIRDDKSPRSLHLFDEIDERLLQYFAAVELSVAECRRNALPALLYIYYLKAMRRLRFYPRPRYRRRLRGVPGLNLRRWRAEPDHVRTRFRNGVAGVED